MEFEDTGSYPQYRARRPRKDVVGEWLTWGVRATIIGLCTLAYREEQQIQATLQATQTTLQLTQITIAKMSVTQDAQGQQLNAHSSQIERIWQQTRENSK